MPYNVINALWFDKIGLVKVQTQYSGIKYYIGKAHGDDEKEDEQWVAKHGKPVSRLMIKEFFNFKEQ